MRDEKKVIIVDESAFLRKILSDFIDALDEFEVVGAYRNIKEYSNYIITINPDIIILELQKEEIQKIEILKTKIINKIKSEIIIITNSDIDNFNICLDESRFKYVNKNYDFTKGRIKEIEAELKESLEDCINRKNKFTYTKQENLKTKEKISIILIGASTGGPKALTKILTNIDKTLNIPILIVQHMPIGFTKAFAERLDKICLDFKVIEAEEGMKIEKNVVYIAKSGMHMMVSENKKIIFEDSNTIWGVKPAIDKLFVSASKVYKRKVLACILTGMGQDGAQGIKIVKENGGVTIAESQRTSLIYGMPKAAIETKKVDYILEVDEIGRKFEKIIKE